MKRTIRLLAMLLSLALLCSVSAFAAGPGGPGGPGQTAAASKGAESVEDLTDFSEVTNKAAVQAMVDFGIINGIQQSDGTYKYDPKANITREAMAKMVAVAVTLAKGSDTITGKAGQFNDVDDRWSKDYVNFCADKQIINGMGDGSFGYDGSITVIQTAKLLMAALGNTTLTGEGWIENTINAANEIKLLNGITSGPNDPITRDEAALIIYNALMSSDGTANLPKVYYLPGGQQNQYTELEITDNTYFSTTAGYNLVLVINGVQQDPQPGKYAGDIWICTPQEVTAVYESHGSKTEQSMSVALYVDEKGVDTAKSVIPALVDVAYNSTGATGGTITAKGDNFGGVRVGGQGKYTVTGMTIDMEGVGGNDFTGMGSAFAVCDEGQLTINNAKVTTNGILRTAAFCGNKGTLTVNNSYFYCNDGGYTAATAPNIPGAGMTTPPKALGVLGYCRATCMVDEGTSYYNDSTIISEMWGALATDDVDGAKLYVDNCVIETKTNGYGAYSIGPCEEYFTDSTFNVASMGIICAAEGHCQLDNTVINSQRYGIVTHQPFGLVSRIYLQNGSEINAKYCGIMVKSRSADIQIDNSTITVTDGPMIQCQYNDDTGAGDIYGQFETTVKISNSQLEGDIVQSQPGKKDDSVMDVSLENTTVTGAITTAVQANEVTDGKFDEENNYLVGRVSNTFAALKLSQLNLTMEAGSVWNVTEASYLTSLSVEEGCTINGDVYVDYTKVEAVGEHEGNIMVLPKGEEAPEEKVPTWADYQKFLCDAVKALEPEEGASAEQQAAIMAATTMEELKSGAGMGVFFEVLGIPDFDTWVAGGCISGAEWAASLSK